MENFIVSARKYRPLTFDSMVGQGHITSTLKNAIARGKIAHAYLFCGPRGVGKTTCARIFAKAINCLNPVDHQACGHCESCLAFDQGRSFTIHELDAASNNSVDDIRSLIDQVRVPPQLGHYSVFIIDEVHMLSTQAFNAFLKTLEEPPAHAIFILATTEKYKIIPTILSRCQIFDFNRIKVDDAVNYLKYIAEKEGITSDEESLHLIAGKADGGMRDALSMFDKVVSFCGNTLEFKQVAQTLNVLDYETYFKITELILASDYQALLLSFDDILRRGFGGQEFISGLNDHFRSLLMAKEPATMSLLEVTDSMAQRYVEQSKHCNTPMLFEAINLLTTTDSSYKFATNQRLHTELALLKLSGLGQKKNVIGTDLPLPKPSAAGVAAKPSVAAGYAKSSDLEGEEKHSAVGGVKSSVDVGAEKSSAVDGVMKPSAADGGLKTSVDVGTEKSSAVDGVMKPSAADGAAKPSSSVSEVKSSVSTVGVSRGAAQAEMSHADGSENVEQEPASGWRHSVGRSQPSTDKTKNKNVISCEPDVYNDDKAPESTSYCSEVDGVVHEKSKNPDVSGVKRSAPDWSNMTKSSMTGLSIKDLMSAKVSVRQDAHGDVAENVDEDISEIVVSEQDTERIASGCLEVSTQLMKERPRLAAALSRVSIDGNIIQIKVPNVTLREEILRNKVELQKMIVAQSEVDFVVDFNVIVEIDDSFIRPIKADDKLKYFIEKSSAFGELCKSLKLDID